MELPDMEKRRLFVMLLCMIAGIMLMMGRLFWIQAVSVSDFSSHSIDLVKRSVIQRERAVELDSGRGQFVDRNGFPLSSETVSALLVNPVRGENPQIQANNRKLARILNISAEEWENYVSNLKAPELWKGRDGKNPVPLTENQAKSVQALHSPLANVVPYTLRYPPNSTARHLIGFLSENPQRVREMYAAEINKGYMTLDTPLGAAGLERTFDRLLTGIGPISIGFFTDAKKRELKGIGTRMIGSDNPYYPLQVVTTLDLSIQRQVEALLERMKMREGAVVVLDARNADVAAMASRPNFDPYQVDPYKNDWNNRALIAVPPGSVFKTVVAAAALEEKAVHPDEEFECKGELGKYGFSCWLKQGHGKLTFEQAFAQSCNIAFAKVMQRLNAEKIAAYARELGLEQQVGWVDLTKLNGQSLRQLPEEEAGQLFASGTPRDDEGVLVQTAIGQRDVRMSPLQAANLVVTLLNGGETLRPRVVRDIRYRNGQLMMTFPEQKEDAEKHISVNTAKLLLGWMREVVDYGTGTALHKAEWKVAGKSGTAQVNNGKVHQWFVGYGPVDKPRYAVAVVVENVPEQASNQALPIFQGVMDIIAGTKVKR